MLVPLTPREIVSMLPRFRIVAVSMERLQIGKARIAAIPTNRGLSMIGTETWDRIQPIDKQTMAKTE
jgi:hypothetical protein